MPAAAPVLRLSEHGAYRRFWLPATSPASAPRSRALAVRVLVVEHLHGGATQVGILNAARWVPYLSAGRARRRRELPRLGPAAPAAAGRGAAAPPPVADRGRHRRGRGPALGVRAPAPPPVRTGHARLVPLLGGDGRDRRAVRAGEPAPHHVRPRLALAAAGLGGLAGSLAAVRLGRRFGAGRVVVVCHALAGVARLVAALASASGLGWVVLGAGQLVLGLGRQPTGRGSATEWPGPWSC